MKQKLIYLLFAVPGFGFGQQEFSLFEAKAYALNNNLQVQNSHYDQQIAEQVVVETRAMGLPQVSINGSFNNFVNLPVQVMDASFFNPMAQPGETIAFRAGTEYNTTGTLQVNQLLFNGSYIVGLQVSKFYLLFQENAKQLNDEQVVFNVIQAYELAATAKDNLQFLDSMVVLTEQLNKEQENYRELGLIQDVVMDQLNYSLQSVKSAQQNAEMQYQNALILLKMVMGYPIDQAINITQSSTQLMLEHAVSSGTIENNLTYQLAEKQITVAEYSLKNVKYSGYPTLSAFFQHSYNAYRTSFDFFANEKWYPQTLWGLQLQVPIFQGGRQGSEMKQAKLKILKEQNNLSLLTQNLKMQELQVKNNLALALNQYELQSSNARLAEKIYRNALIKKEIGQINSIEVTQKYNQLMEAQSMLVAAQLEVFKEKLNLDKLYNQLLK